MVAAIGFLRHSLTTEGVTGVPWTWDPHASVSWTVGHRRGSPCLAVVSFPLLSQIEFGSVPFCLILRKIFLIGIISPYLISILKGSTFMPSHPTFFQAMPNFPSFPVTKCHPVTKSHLHDTFTHVHLHDTFTHVHLHDTLTHVSPPWHFGLCSCSGFWTCIANA